MPLPMDKKATAILKLDAYCQSLIKAINTLIHIDRTKHPDSPESDFMMDPSLSGSSIHQILHFSTNSKLARSCPFLM